jgi:Ni,Fe-hydrogenase III small subunit/formate hydrogenlyase subunit 6/NADH:ubiquinone oxidoreductase subunit I
MFDILRKSFSVGVVTTTYPESPAVLSSQARGCPKIDFARWTDARAAVEACPTQALSLQDTYGERTVLFDLAKCTFCGLCAEADSAITMSSACELAVRQRGELKQTARYRLNREGRHQECLEQPQSASNRDASLDELGEFLGGQIRRVLGRSLHIREVDAGSCNGCEVEIHALNSPIYDIERFGIHFVASPRHADMLLVTGPVTRNMELALRKTYNATPAPRLVVAVGACGCSGGIFGQNYASLGSVDRILPVDVYIPGCPPNPHSLLHGILLAVGRLEQARTQPAPVPDPAAGAL